ncbi:MAG TPA: YfhO family protein [Candidatus Blautia faecigallinarum]|uniref:YfhO family protein n=1 Tax=Candidatus Blautia faecigallinarum TaxID=2838488 RepID=A0A9D2DRB5_9FIRM|nr:YfhO family protein [Candidatus Blautia faecigallinarum]
MRRKIFTEKLRNIYKYFAMGEDRRRFYRNYTLLALFFFAFITAIFYGNGKSFVWSSDGLKQHYTALAYYGNYLRSILKNILVEHTFEIPMWDLHIGYGSDILTALSYYVMGDPVNLLSVFVPERFTEYLYGFLIFLRIYLAGLAFSRYAFFHGNRQIPVFLGTVIYITSQWSLAIGFNHPFFLNPCIYFPLMLLGVDRILAGKKPYVYILTLGLAGMVNFYFFYMMGILTVAYGVLRYFMVYKGLRLRILWKTLLKFFLYSVLGISLAAVILVPSVMQVLGTGRMGASYYVPLLYSTVFYGQLPGALIGTGAARYTTIGVAGVCALSIPVLFFCRKRYRGIKAGFLCLVLLFCIPYAAHVLNGFSYVSNRWSWAGVLFFAYLFVKMYPEFFALNLRERVILCVASVLYGGFVVWYPKAHVLGNKLAGLTVILTGLGFLWVQGQGRTGRRRMRRLLAGSVAVSVAAGFFGAFWLGRNGWERTAKYEDAGTVYAVTHDEVQTALQEIQGIDAYRYEKGSVGSIYNDAMLNGLNSGQYYFSVAPYGVSDFFEANYVDNPAEQRIIDLGGRSWLMKLFSMRYFVGREGEVPYGYSPVETDAALPEGVGIYEDTSALPLVYTYDSYIKEETYEGLDPAKKQEAMLEGAVLSESGLPKCDLTFHSKEISYEIVEAKGVRVEEDGVYVKGKEGYLVLELEGLPGCETGVAFTGIRYEGLDRTHRFPFEDSSVTEGNIYAGIEGEGQEKLLSLRSPKSRFQGGRGCYMLDLGYQEAGVERIRIRFENPGKYSFSSLKVYCQEMEPLNRLADERRQDTVEGLAAEGNTLRCSVTLDGDRAVVFSIPYSQGWSLTVDGKEAELKKANGLFLAAEEGKGTHEIILRYRTPYIRLGAALSAWGALVLCGTWVYRKKKD